MYYFLDGLYLYQTTYYHGNDKEDSPHVSCVGKVLEGGQERQKNEDGQEHGIHFP